MASNNDKTPTSHTRTAIPLLPAYFKKIGLLVLILSFVPAIVVKIFSIEMIAYQQATLKYLCMNSIIIGMLLIAFAKDKIENDQSISLRLKTMVFAILMAVCLVVLKPITDLLVGDPISDMNGKSVAFNMLAFYLSMYYLQKKGRLMLLSKPIEKSN